jgi:Ca-activated chloride channel family protein
MSVKKLYPVLLGCVVLLAACKPSNDADAPATDDAHTLTVVAGSELKDIEPLLPDVQRATGVRLKLNYAGTLDAVERLKGGEAGDAAWLASNRYAMLMPDVRARIVASERTMLTPVVLGIKQSKAHALGWDKQPDVTWKDIAKAATDGKFTFGMTSPASSNSGFSGLLGLAAALSGKGDALEEKDIDGKRLAAFFKAQRLTAGSSGWLVDAYIREQGQVDGLINYASTLLSLNAKPALKEKLVLIYPRDGIVTADYPLMLVNPAKRAAYDKVVAYLRDKPFQQAMATATLRRPVNADVQTPDQPAQALVELPFPAKLAVVDAILASFDNDLCLPTDSTFVLDKSGSMYGSRIADLQTAMLGLSGADASISGRFARFRNRERICLLPFSSFPEGLTTFDMGADGSSNGAALKDVTQHIQDLRADGGTAIYDSLRQAYAAAIARRHADPARFYSVVLMTDGENSSGANLADFTRWYDSLPAGDKGIKLFPIVFGEADQGEMQRLAELTGGRSFDSRKSNLQAIFKEVRGYQ